MGEDPTLEKGATLTVHTNDEWKEKCDKDNLYMDYKNLPKVMTVGGLIFVDDGLISLKVRPRRAVVCHCTWRHLVACNGSWRCCGAPFGSKGVTAVPRATRQIAPRTRVAVRKQNRKAWSPPRSAHRVHGRAGDGEGRGGGDAYVLSGELGEAGLA